MLPIYPVIRTDLRAEGPGAEGLGAEDLGAQGLLSSGTLRMRASGTEGLRGESTQVLSVGGPYGLMDLHFQSWYLAHEAGTA